ncbi:MAG: 4Fe-4S ferredoxin [Candidatus Firestonebacteria bacterium]|nr:4Fe-4S ferredoxin [Candidatus Firestonebacteria bacterium]
MNTVLYYYTGTGNSLWSARLFAKELQTGEPVSLARDPEASRARSVEAVGLIFPVHMWGVPGVVLNFIAHLPADKYYFAVAVNAGQVSATLLQLRKVMAQRGLNLSLGVSLRMPSNYIPWGGPGSSEEIDRRFRQSREKIRQTAPAVRSRQTHPMEKGPWWQRVLFTGIYKMSFPYIAKMDKDFWVDTACNGCALCVKICPVRNIRLQNQKPVWGHGCEQCLACIQWCPQQSIQFGKKTPGITRYHQPEVKAADMLAGAPRK